MRGLTKIKLSVFYQLKDLYETGVLMGEPWAVLDEDHLRAGYLPARPHVMLLDYGVDFRSAPLPLVVVQHLIGTRPFQMGGRDAFDCRLTLHVFGRTRMERDEMAGALIETIQSIAIRDFDYMDAPPLLDEVRLDGIGEATWVYEDHALPFDLQVEGTLANWSTVSTQYTVLRTA